MIGLVAIAESDCRTLLNSTDLGRVLITIDALPAAFPVSYRMIDDAIVFRTSPGAKLNAAFDRKVVGFEVDQVDTANQVGWSVLVVGTSAVITDPDEIASLDRHGIRSLIRADLPFYVKISTDRVSGRRLPPAG